MSEESRSAEPSVEEMASKLKGKTLTVYWFLLRNLLVLAAESTANQPARDTKWDWAF